MKAPCYHRQPTCTPLDIHFALALHYLKALSIQVQNVILEMTLFSCQIDYSSAECDKSSPMPLETFLNKVKERWVECTTYTRCSQKFNIGQSLIPPIMAPSIRRSDVLNTEAQKRSVVLKSMNNKSQGVYFFLSLSIVY